MVELNNISFHYKKKKHLFDKLSLTLEPGNIYGLLGRNGAGKTTLLKILCGLLYPSSGQAVVNNFDTRTRSTEAMSKLFFLPEDLYVPDMKARFYISTYKSFYPSFDTEMLEEFANEFAVNLDESLGAMSFGQKKKFFIAFGLATRTPLIIMDEPTNGLDIPSKSLLRKVISNSISEDQTILISTHQARDLQSLIDPIIVVESGQIIFKQSLAEIENKFEFLTFKHSEKPENLIYSEDTAIGGFGIRPAEGRHGNSRVELELLFNAIIQQKENINKYIN